MVILEKERANEILSELQNCIVQDNYPPEIKDWAKRDSIRTIEMLKAYLYYFYVKNRKLQRKDIIEDQNLKWVDRYYHGHKQWMDYFMDSMVIKHGFWKDRIRQNQISTWRSPSLLDDQSEKI
jgi:hypothetical protein